MGEKLSYKICVIFLMLLWRDTLAQKAVTRIGNLRLSGGKNGKEGNVEVEVNGVWGFICDDGFGFPEADAVCRELGHSGALRFTRNNNFGEISAEWLRSEVRYWLDELSCENATRIRNCNSSKLGDHDCGPTEVAGVVCRNGEASCSEDEFFCEDESEFIAREAVCDGERDCSDGSDESEELCEEVGVVRMSESSTRLRIPGMVAGPVQVKWRGRWWYVCDLSVLANEAKVLCRNLGYVEGWAVPLAGSYLGEDRTLPAMEIEGCEGNEQRITECSPFASSREFCQTLSTTSVVCSDGSPSVRVEGGFLQLKLPGREWAAVCGQSFDDFDAKVACREMGYEGDAEALMKPRVSRGPLWNVILDCVGHEESLSQCRLRLRNGTCDSAAALRCSRWQGAVDAQLSTVLPRNCGTVEDASNQYIGSLAKVRGGAIPSRFDAPWIVSFRIKPDLEGGGKLICGGSIISEDLVLTAGHCFLSVDKFNLVVRVGDFDSGFVEGPFEQEFLIDKVWVHEKFEDLHFLDNDIALVRIERKNGMGFRFNGRVRPICLPLADDSYDDLGLCTVAGWGRTFALLSETSKPHQVEMNIAPDSRCETFFGSFNYTSSKMCAASDNPLADRPCVGDSGGALVCTVRGRKTVFGLVSSGPLCGLQAGPDVFVRVTKYIRWLQEKIAPFPKSPRFPQ